MSATLHHSARVFSAHDDGQNNSVFSGVSSANAATSQYNNEPTTLKSAMQYLCENVTVHRGTTHSMKTVIGNDSHNNPRRPMHHWQPLHSQRGLARGACDARRQCDLVGTTCTSFAASVDCLLAVVPRRKRTSSVRHATRFGQRRWPNLVGMKRAGMSRADRHRTAFKMLFREGLVLPAAPAANANSANSTSSRKCSPVARMASTRCAAVWG